MEVMNIIAIPHRQIHLALIVATTGFVAVVITAPAATTSAPPVASTATIRAPPTGAASAVPGMPSKTGKELGMKESCQFLPFPESKRLR